jgi:hypothetical protein
MRMLIALALMTSPALAHPAGAPHLHEIDGIWSAGLAFATGMALTLRVLVQAVRAKA